ncbi:hypothetical protein [Oceanithermus sp.]
MQEAGPDGQVSGNRAAAPRVPPRVFGPGAAPVRKNRGRRGRPKADGREKKSDAGVTGEAETVFVRGFVRPYS